MKLCIKSSHIFLSHHDYAIILKQNFGKNMMSLYKSIYFFVAMLLSMSYALANRPIVEDDESQLVPEDKTMSSEDAYDYLKSRYTYTPPLKWVPNIEVWGITELYNEGQYGSPESTTCKLIGAKKIESLAGKSNATPERPLWSTTYFSKTDYGINKAEIYYHSYDKEKFKYRITVDYNGLQGGSSSCAFFTNELVKLRETVDALLSLNATLDRSRLVKTNPSDRELRIHKRVQRNIDKAMKNAKAEYEASRSGKKVKNSFQIAKSPKDTYDVFILVSKSLQKATKKHPNITSIPLNTNLMINGEKTSVRVKEGVYYHLKLNYGIHHISTTSAFDPGTRVSRNTNGGIYLNLQFYNVPSYKNMPFSWRSERGELLTNMKKKISRMKKVVVDTNVINNMNFSQGANSVAKSLLDKQKKKELILEKQKEDAARRQAAEAERKRKEDAEFNAALRGAVGVFNNELSKSVNTYSSSNSNTSSSSRNYSSGSSSSNSATSVSAAGSSISASSQAYGYMDCITNVSRVGVTEKEYISNVYLINDGKKSSNESASKRQLNLSSEYKCSEISGSDAWDKQRAELYRSRIKSSSSTEVVHFRFSPR